MPILTSLRKNISDSYKRFTVNLLYFAEAIDSTRLAGIAISLGAIKKPVTNITPLFHAKSYSMAIYLSEIHGMVPANEARGNDLLAHFIKRYNESYRAFGAHAEYLNILKHFVPKLAKNINNPVTNGDFLLDFADDEQVIRLLVDNGANPNVVTRHHRQILLREFEKGAVGTVLYLLSKGASPSFIPVETLLSSTHIVPASLIAIAQKLLALSYVDPKGKREDDSKTFRSSTFSLSEYIVKYCQVRNLKQILGYIPAEMRAAMLDAAIKAGNIDNVEVLLDKSNAIDIKVNECRSDRVPAIFHAAQFANTDPVVADRMIKSLQRVGANINQEVPCGSSVILGRTLLHRAAQEESGAVINALVQNGADANAQDYCDLRYEDALRATNMEISRSTSRSTISLAVTEISWGATPLHLAASKHNLSAIKALLAAGALYMRDAQGVTPSDYASRNLYGSLHETLQLLHTAHNSLVASSAQFITAVYASCRSRDASLKARSDIGRALTNVARAAEDTAKAGVFGAMNVAKSAVAGAVKTVNSTLTATLRS